MAYPNRPRYLTSAFTIRKKIREGSFPPNSVLPSQKELARRFQTSVMTVRQALSVLEQEGLITLKHGVGTFVALGGIKDRVFRLQGFQDEMSEHRIKISTKIIKRRFSVSDKRISKLLKVKENRGICLLTRLRLIGTVPIVLQHSFIPPEYSDVVENYREKDSLYAFLSEAAGQIVIRGNEIVHPVSLGPDEAALLKQPAGTTAFLSHRLSSNLSGRVILFDEAYIPGNRVVISRPAH